MHVVLEDGRVFTGYDAYRQLAWVLPATWALLPVLYLPPVRWVGWKVYRYVASHRHDAGCEVPDVTSAEAGGMGSPHAARDPSPMHSPPQREAHGRDAHATIESTR